MAEADEYEALPPTAPLYLVAGAGALAGVAEHCAMFPVDSVKTRMQALACDKQKIGMIGVMKTMVKEEGMARPFKGMTAMMAGAGPAHAMYFGALETGRNLTAKYKVPVHIGDGLSAVFATCLHDAVMTPAEVVKQRMQMCCSPYCKPTECAGTVFKSEGLRAFYRSYMTSLSMNIPFQAAMVMTYGKVQREVNPDKAYRPEVHFLAGAVAGGVASAITMPLDVCKTLLNTQESGVLKARNVTEVRGLVNAGLSVYKMMGWRGFFQGLTPRILYQAPSTAISWSVYEFFKYIFWKDSSDDIEKYETGSAVMKNASAPGQIDSRVGHLRPGMVVVSSSSPEEHQETLAVPTSMRL